MNNVFWLKTLPFDQHYKSMLQAPNFYEQYRYPMIIHGERCNITSSYNNHRGTAAENELNEYCINLYNDAMDDFFARLGVLRHIRYKYYYWWQIYNPDVKGSLHPKHSHWTQDGAAFSWVHFIQTNNEHCFRFAGEYNETDVSIKEKGNEIIFFHPLLLHQAVKPTKGTRIIIAGNINITEDELSTY